MKESQKLLESFQTNLKEEKKYKDFNIDDFYGNAIMKDGSIITCNKVSKENYDNVKSIVYLCHDCGNITKMSKVMLDNYKKLYYEDENEDFIDDFISSEYKLCGRCSE